MKEKIRKYMITALCMAAFILPMLQPLTVRAAETGQFISVYGKEGWINENSGLSCTQEYSFEMQVKSDYTVYGYLVDSIRGGYSGKCLQLAVVQNNKTVGGLVTNSMAIKYLDVLNGTYVTYDGNKSVETELSLDNNNGFYRMILIEPYEDTTYLDYSWSGIDVFSSLDSFNSYLASGTTDGLIEPPKDIDKDGELDESIGYLHNLKKNFLNSGEKDENGIGNLSYSFSWDDTYPKYDDSYKVEVRASCNVGVKSFFGLGNEKTTISDIRNVSECNYNDLSILIEVNELKNVFSDFLTKNLPSGSDISDFGKTGSYNFTYYFRIYRYDEELGIYKYGKWVRMLSNGNVLDGDIGYTDSLGDLDSDGKWVIDPNSDYGDGLGFTTGSGEGSTIEAAIQNAEENRQAQLDFQTSDLGGMTNWFVSQIKSMIDALGTFPSFIGSLFTFLPAQVIVFIAIGLVAVVICRFLGR